MKLNEKLWKLFPSSSFSSVMGIGIVSDAFFQLGLNALSTILLLSGIVLYLALVCIFIFVIANRLGKIFNSKLNQISVLGSFSFVAGTAVLVTRMSESGIVFLDLPALAVCTLFIILLTLVLVFKTDITDKDHSVHIERPYLYLIPFIAFFSTSVLSSQTFLKIDMFRQYLFLISVSTWFIGLLGIVVFLSLTIVKHREKFRHPEIIDGFYMIYSGIASLLSFSGVVMIEFYDLSNVLLLSFFHMAIIAAFAWAVVSTVPLFYIFARKLIYGKMKMRHRVSIWGAVFPVGIDSMGSFFVSKYFHFPQAIYLSYVYAAIGFALIVADIIGVVISTVNRDYAIIDRD